MDYVHQESRVTTLRDEILGSWAWKEDKRRGGPGPPSPRTTFR